MDPVQIIIHVDKQTLDTRVRTYNGAPDERIAYAACVFLLKASINILHLDEAAFIDKVLAGVRTSDDGG